MTCKILCMLMIQLPGTAQGMGYRWDWLVGWLVGWLVCGLVGWLVGWWVGWLVGWLATMSCYLQGEEMLQGRFCDWPFVNQECRRSSSVRYYPWLLEADCHLYIN
jgi:hypothetical protein